MLKIDGHDNAVIGTATPWINGRWTEVLVYDGQAIVKNLVVRDDMTLDEAREYIEFNIEGAYVGDETPIIVWKCDLDELE
jgi:hypothetical protein